jgi:hypothetical protein
MRHGQQLIVFWCWIGSATVGCVDQPGDPPAGPSRDELQQILTGAAAAALDHTGHFRLATPSSTSNELSLSQAQSLATAWITTAGPSFRRTLEGQRGGPIDFTSLRTCGQTVYAATPFQPFPSSVPLGVQRHYVSRWLVGFCGKSGGLEVSVAVSSLATELKVVNGRVDYGRSDGNEFFALGTPAGWDGPAGLSAERAAASVARQTGRRIKEVPALIAADPRISYPQGAVWRLRLDSPVTLKAKKDGRLVNGETVYAGLHGDVQNRKALDEGSTLRVSAAQQPADVEIRFPFYPPGTIHTPETEPSTGSARLVRRSDTPIALERAAAGGN